MDMCREQGVTVAITAARTWIGGAETTAARAYPVPKLRNCAQSAT